MRYFLKGFLYGILGISLIGLIWLMIVRPQLTLPQTGDLPWLPVALGVVAAGAAVGILVMSRKRDLALRDDDSKQEQQDHEQ